MASRSEKVTRRQLVTMLGTGILGTAVSGAEGGDGLAISPVAACAEDAVPDTTSVKGKLSVTFCCEDVKDIIMKGYATLAPNSPEQKRLQPMINAMNGVNYEEHGNIQFNLVGKQLDVFRTKGITGLNSLLTKKKK